MTSYAARDKIVIGNRPLERFKHKKIVIAAPTIAKWNIRAMLETRGDVNNTRQSFMTYASTEVAEICSATAILNFVLIRLLTIYADQDDID